MYLCRKYTNASLKEIGRAFDRDHTSVIYAIEVVERRVVERPQLRYELETLAARFSSDPGTRS
jgi:chromosomal replication initiator protein